VKKSQATKILDSDIQVFAEKITAIEMGIFFSEKEMVASHKEYKKIAEELADRNILYKSMSINSLGTDLVNGGKRIFLGSSFIHNEQVMAAVIDNLNLQCCWHLVSAYEEYESFLKRIYGSLGYLDHNSWNCKDFGNIKLSEISSKKIEWYRELSLSNSGKHNAKYILKSLRKVFPNLSEIEKNTTHPKEFLLNLKLIELLRHIIVHKSGYTDSNAFIELLFKNAGRSLNEKGKDMKFFKYKLNGYFEGNESIKRIVVINKSSIKGNYAFVTLPVKTLVEGIKTHACLIYHMSLLHFGIQPYWIRT
jgi:hypothetical protein